MTGIAAILLAMCIGVAATGDLYNSTCFAAIAGLLIMLDRHRHSRAYKARLWKD
jgi:uncharacterized membrane protein YhiD involved in acid resistance